MDRLEKVGILVREKSCWKIEEKYIQALSEVPSQAIRNYHRQILSKAIDALDHQTMDQREITGLGFAIDPKNLKDLKGEIAHFMDQMVQKYSVTKIEKTEVYQLEMALFKLTKDA